METKENKFVLRCVAYRGQNRNQEGYYAVCLDLCLVTWRPDFKSAKSSLNTAIYGYIESKAQIATKEDLDNPNKYFLRRAPFFPFWVMYYKAKFFEIFKDSKRPNGPKVYDKPVSYPDLSAACPI